VSGREGDRCVLRQVLPKSSPSPCSAHCLPAAAPASGAPRLGLIHPPPPTHFYSQSHPCTRSNTHKRRRHLETSVRIYVFDTPRRVCALTMPWSAVGCWTRWHPVKSCWTSHRSGVTTHPCCWNSTYQHPTQQQQQRTVRLQQSRVTSSSSSSGRRSVLCGRLW
jgi:hypothetical protein